MTFYYKNVYLTETATITGPYEKNGPLRKYFDKTYNDLYMGEKSFEKAEIKLVRDSLVMIMKKSGINKKEVDLVIGGDLLNQITASTYGSYGDNAICLVSSHNMTSEKQFRYPTEYGAPRPNTATFTATGAACSYLTNEEDDIRIESATLGRIIDYEQKDPNDMGRAMAPAVIDTLLRHFKDTNRSPEDYDLILTGDLGIYGKEIVKDYLQRQYKLDLNNYNDCGVMLYDLKEQKEVRAGGSGPVCSALVTYSYIFDELKKKKIKRVLLLATGALFSPIMLYQKENINSICHAISLEAV